MKKQTLTLNIKLMIQITVVAIYLIGCSGANPAPTPEATPTDTPTLIPTATNTPLPSTKTRTHTPIPPTPTPEKPESYYLQISEELKNNFSGIIQLNNSPTGLDINNFTDDGSYEIKQLKKYIGYFIELSCNRPEMLADIKFEPFALENNSGKSLDINVGNCFYNKQSLEKLEENGHMISLTHPVFEPGTSNMLVDLFDGIKRSSNYDTKDAHLDFYSSQLRYYNGMVIGIKDYEAFMLDLVKAFNLDTEGLYFGIAEFKSNATGFTIPVDSQGNIVFSKVMIIPKGTTPNQIEKIITRGTASDVGLFFNKILFRSEALP